MSDSLHILKGLNKQLNASTRAFEGQMRIMDKTLNELIEIGGDKAKEKIKEFSMIKQEMLTALSQKDPVKLTELLTKLSTIQNGCSPPNNK